MLNQFSKKDSAINFFQEDIPAQIVTYRICHFRPRIWFKNSMQLFTENIKLWKVLVEQLAIPCHYDACFNPVCFFHGNRCTAHTANTHGCIQNNNIKCFYASSVNNILQLELVKVRSFFIYSFFLKVYGMLRPIRQDLF